MTERAFNTEHVTEGKIAVDDDRSTPVFSPYAGRVTKLLARPGDSVTQGQRLFIIEAADKVQAQNDFVAAVGALAKARSQLSSPNCRISAPGICSRARPSRSRTISKRRLP